MGIETPRWADVPGYAGRYQASTDGRVRLVYQDGRAPLTLKPYVHANGALRNRNPRTLKVRLITPAGKRKEVPVLSVVSMTWLPCPPGMVVVHRNGLMADNSVENVMFITRQQLGIHYGRQGRRRTVCKVDRAGNVLECYGSAREAARRNYMSASSLTDRCNGRTLNPWAPDGTTFQWEEGKQGRKRRQSHE